MRLERILLLVLTASLMSGCDVVRGGVFIATVSHYHGGESRVYAESPAPQQAESSTDPVPVRVPPRVPQSSDE